MGGAENVIRGGDAHGQLAATVTRHGYQPACRTMMRIQIQEMEGRKGRKRGGGRGVKTRVNLLNNGTGELECTDIYTLKSIGPVDTIE